VILATVGLLVLVISVVFILVKQSNERPEASVQYEAPSGSRISADDLALLADGRHPDGEALLERSLSTARLVMRDTISRSEPSLAWVEWSPPGFQLSEDMWFGQRLDVAVGDGEWELGRWAYSAHHESMISLDLGPVTQRLYVPVEDVIPDDTDSIILRVRVSLRVQRNSLQSLGEAFQGTQASWSESRRLSLVDEYPADYPRPIVGPAQLAAHYIPVELGLNSSQDQAGVLLMGARFPPRPSGLPQGAFEVELSEPGRDELIARGPLVLSNDPEGVEVTYIAFEIVEQPGPAVEAVLQELRSGDQSVRLDVRLEPSRELALSKQTGNDYWAQPISATLDVGRSFQPFTLGPEEKEDLIDKVKGLVDG